MIIKQLLEIMEAWRGNAVNILVCAGCYILQPIYSDNVCIYYCWCWCMALGYTAHSLPAQPSPANNLIPRRRPEPAEATLLWVKLARNLCFSLQQQYFIFRLFEVFYQKQKQRAKTAGLGRVFTACCCRGHVTPILQCCSAACRLGPAGCVCAAQPLP